MSDIKEKIRKLLATAEGTANEHESDTALRLASELMMRHGITEDQLHAGKPSAIKRGEHFELDADWQEWLQSSCGRLYGVKPLRHRYGREVTFSYVGRSDNIGAAQDTLAYLMVQVEFAYKAHLPKGLSKPDRANFRKSFKRACALGISTRITALLNQQLSGTGNAIVVHRDHLTKEIDDFLAEAIPDLKKARKSRSIAIQDYGAWSKGSAASDKIDLHRKVAG